MLGRTIKMCKLSNCNLEKAHLPEYDIPAPTDGHGWDINEGVLEPKWNSGDILPQNIVDLLVEEGDFEDAEEEDDS